MDDFRNHASAYVTTGYSAGATSIVVEAGFGARFPTAPFNATWWNYEDYPDPDFDPDRETVRVTAISTDTLTITRAQEGTAATAKNIADKTYRIMATITAKTLDDDIEPNLLGTNRVTTAMVQAAAITLAKMANMATASILGRLTAGTGAPEVLTALPFALSGDISTAAGANVTAIGADKVLTAMILNSQVTLAKIANISTARVLGRVTAGSGVVEELSSLPFAVDLSGSAATGILASARFPALSGDVTTSAGSVATVIGAAAVSLSKMANMATDSILGRATAGTGSPEVLTALPWAFTGDVTSTADSNALAIANDAVTTAKILNANVTLAKMADIATDSILGRATAATGAVEVLTALPWAFTGDVTSSADANALSIAANAVVTAKIADANVTLAKLADMATDSILGRATAATGVPEVLTALPWAFTGDVTSAADANALTIAADAVTFAKMQNVSAASRLIGRGSAGGSGDPEEITLGAGLTMTGTSLSASGGAVAGSDTQVQFNDGGAFGGDAGLTYAKTTDLLSLLGSPGANTSPVFGIEAKNANAATAANQQYSGGFFWEGQGWKTNSVAASQSVRARTIVVPVQGAASPTGNFFLDWSINGGAFGGALTISSIGSLTVGTNASIYMAAKSAISADSSGNSYFTLSNLTTPAPILMSCRVLAKTANYPVVALDSNTVFTNEGASSKPNFTLPTAVSGYKYTFIVQDADGITVTAAAGDTIRLAGTVSAAAGNADSTTIGSVIQLVSINATEWVALYSTGSWTIT